MAVIRFTAVNRGELPSWLSAGATFYVANNFQGFPRRLVAKREIDETLDGTPEGYLHALQREYTIATDFIPLYERDVWRAFFSSVLGAETFAIDFSATQQLGNPGFESGSTTPWVDAGGWSGFATNSTAGLQALGRYAAQATMTINANGQAFRSQLMAAVPGQTWVLQGAAKRSESSVPNRDVQLYGMFFDGATAFLAQTLIGEAVQTFVGYQPLSGVTAAAPANTAFVALMWIQDTPLNTNEAGQWLFDEHILALLGSWQNVYLVDSSIEEQQIGGVGVKYSFRVRTLP
jgi:hypothetical protein